MKSFRSLSTVLVLLTGTYQGDALSCLTSYCTGTMESCAKTTAVATKCPTPKDRHQAFCFSTEGLAMNAEGKNKAFYKLQRCLSSDLYSPTASLIDYINVPMSLLPTSQQFLVRDQMYTGREGTCLTDGCQPAEAVQGSAPRCYSGICGGKNCKLFSSTAVAACSQPPGSKPVCVGVTMKDSDMSGVSFGCLDLNQFKSAGLTENNCVTTSIGGPTRTICTCPASSSGPCVPFGMKKVDAPNPVLERVK